jgi:hypothetical protein
MQKEMTLSFFVCMFALALFFGCTPKEALKPLETAKRIKVRITSFEDLTGTYDKTLDRVEQRTRGLLDSSFIREVFISRDNRYNLWTYQNPLINDDSSTNVIEIKGEVERCSYEKKVDINERISSYHFFGIWGMSNYRDSDLCGFIQIRVRVFDSLHRQIDSTVIVGVSCGNIIEHSRKEIISKAISNASYNMMVNILDILSNKYSINVPRQRESIDEEEAEHVKYLQ